MTTVVFVNESKVSIDLPLLNKIVDASELPEYRIIILAANTYLMCNNLAQCNPRILAKYFDDYYFRKYFNIEWDFGIVLSSKVTPLFNEFPTLFSFLLGHEFGHIKAWSIDPDIYILGCLLYSHLRILSNDKLSMVFEHPVERECDKFGLFLTEKIFSKEQFESDLAKIFSNDILSPDYVNSIRHIINLKEPSDFKSLKEKQIRLALPYKDALKQILVEDSIKKTEPALSKCLISNYDQLFRF
jgi:hypothetical protein